MSGLHRDDGGADFDALGDLPEQRDRSQGVQIARHLRDPDRRETCILGGATVGDQAGQPITALPFLIGSDHQT